MIGNRRVVDVATLWELFNLGDREATEWMRDGVCAQTDPEVFFPVEGGDPRPAKAVCGGCLARESCLAYAVDRPALSGIWGGTSERQRQKIRRQLRRQAADRRAA